ncbi:YggT family protein, partial [Rheinheimera maricola]|uniref:YggT family protein n=1 Tax=Rheinheimera maricola TaxID=2793282 RepID=UPI0019666121
VLSWVQPQSPAYGVLSRLLEPVLSPFQRAIPRIGGVDLSALLLMLVLQVLLGLLRLFSNLVFVLGQCVSQKNIVYIR